MAEIIEPVGAEDGEQSGGGDAHQERFFLIRIRRILDAVAPTIRALAIHGDELHGLMSGATRLLALERRVQKAIDGGREILAHLLGHA